MVWPKSIFPTTCPFDGSKPKGKYHHGDLPSALIMAAELVLTERGVDGFSLREVARRAGVTPGAPSHHFKDTKGLLTALSTKAFLELGARMQAELLSASSEKGAQILSVSQAYVDFALEKPAIFDVMWRKALLNNEDQALLESSHIGLLLVCQILGEDPEAPSPKIMALWSLVHGFARLKLDGACDDEAVETKISDLLAYIDLK